MWIFKPGNRNLKLELFFTILIGTSIVRYISSQFFPFIENRKGAVIFDPFLALFQPVDVTWVAFALIYFGLFVGIIALVRFPDRFCLGLQTYVVMMLFRAIAMYFLPLDPPERMILLRDPFVEVVGGSGKALTRDLFFSGHTSTMFLLFQVTRSKLLKNSFLLATFGIAACVLIQHVHYTIDVFSAPFFAYGAYRLTLFVRHKLKLS